MLITIYYWTIHSGHINHHRHRHRNGTKNLFKQFSLLSILFLLTSGPIIIDCNQWNHNNNNSQYNNDGEYSIANFLPSFTKSLLFWRQSDSSANISQKSVNPTPIITREISHSPVITSAALMDDSLSPYNNQSMMMINTYPSTTTILPDLNRNRQCFSCQNNGDYMYQDSNEEYRQRIEFIKEQILNKLGLKEPPKLPNQPDIDLINMCMYYFHSMNQKLIFFIFLSLMLFALGNQIKKMRESLANYQHRQNEMLTILNTMKK